MSSSSSSSGSFSSSTSLSQTTAFWITTDDELKQHIDNLEKPGPDQPELVAVLFDGNWGKYSRVYETFFDGLPSTYPGRKVVFMKFLLLKELKYLQVEYEVKTFPSVHLFKRNKKVDKVNLPTKKVEMEDLCDFAKRVEQAIVEALNNV